MRKPLPSIDRVRALFHYSEAGGCLLWKKRETAEFPRPEHANQWNTKFAGKRAGTTMAVRRGKTPRYVSIRVYGAQYYEHHLVMAWHGEVCPPHLEIDHKDDNPRNNRISNLRFVTRSMNCRKQSHGEGGVRFFRGKWMARITVEGVRKFLGNFASESEAIAARRAAEPDPLLQPCSKESRAE